MNKLVLFLALTAVGCANTQLLDQAKREAAYRQQLDLSESSTVPTAGVGPIEMPKEWMNQWPNQTN